MSDPISTVVKIAANPEQAKMFVAQLTAVGIPASTDSAPPDEFSMSQRMMNLNGCKVIVPTEAHERAKEILSEHQDVDLDELTRQAIEADNPDGPPIGSNRE
jgi:hypothetical protein